MREHVQRFSRVALRQRHGYRVLATAEVHRAPFAAERLRENQVAALLRRVIQKGADLS